MYVSQLARQRLWSEVEKVRQSFGQKLASTEIVASAVQDLAHAIGPGELPEAALQDFAASVMEKNPAIRSMLYYMRVDAAERTIFEADLAKRGITDGIVSTSASDSNAIEKAADAAEYFVLTTGDRPAIGNLFIGWNMLSDQARATALTKSLRRGAPTATDAYLLADGNSAIEVLVPVYRSGRVETPASGAPTLVAAIGIVVDLTAMLGDVELRKNFTTILNTRFSAEESPRSVYRSLDESGKGFWRLSRFEAVERFSLFSYEIILAFEKEIFLSRINYGILVAVGLFSLLIFILALYLAYSIEHIASLNRGLERKVEIRTQELAQSKNEIQEILDNLDDAIIIIDDKQRIQARHSPSAPRMFGRESIVGMTLSDLILKDVDLKDETVSRHGFTLGMLFHSDSFQWEISSSNLLRSVQYIHPGKEGAAARRSLSVRYAPLYDNDSLERILVIISDVTELMALRQDVEHAREQSSMRLQIVAEMLAADRSSLSSFFEETEARAVTLRGILAEVEGGEQSMDSLALLFREIHTLKGNARMLKFARLARESHGFEDVHADLIKDRQLQSAEQRGSLAATLSQLLATLEQYQATHAEIFAGQSSKNDAVKIWAEVRHLTQLFPVPDLLGHTVQARAEDRAFRLENLWREYQGMVQDVSNGLGKKLAPLKIQGDAWLNRKVQGPLRDALTHLVRNALDHGIEPPEQRGNKAPDASLTLKVEVAGSGQLELQLEDDGRGIDHDLVFQIAKKRGLVPLDGVQPAPEDVYELLFAAGFSTKSEASDISGRGVGLDAVRSGLQDHGGEVFVSSKKGQGTIFHIRLPADHVFVACRDSRILPLQGGKVLGAAS
jgi:signal transduction histidine kinase